MGNILGNVVFLPWIQVALILALVYLAYIDLRTFRLPDAITLPLILSGLLFNGFSAEGLVPFQESVIGALLGYTSLWLLNSLYRLTKKQDGIGMGDAKLLAALGGTTTKGAIAFAEMSGQIRNSEFGKNMQMTGVTTGQLDDYLSGYLETQQKLGKIEGKIGEKERKGIFSFLVFRS